MKLIKFILIISLTFIKVDAMASDVKNAYDFSFNAIDGKNKIDLSSHQGKLIMVVNTASLCGFTKQYSELQQLYETYKDRGFVLIAVPSNDFGKQEPGSSQEIKSFCETNFGITFPITEKVQVTGDNADPFFVWTRSQLGVLSGPKWNFYKYLIDKNGKIITWFSSYTKPLSPKIIKIIEENL